MPSALLLPVLTCAVVLLVSGVAKLRAPETVDAAFTSLEVPKALDTTFVRRRLAVGRGGAGRLAAARHGRRARRRGAPHPGPLRAPTSRSSRAPSRRPEPVDCGCFGALGDSRVTRVTVWRNGALVLSRRCSPSWPGCRGWALIGAVVDGDALPWIAMAALTAAVAVLVAYRAPTAASTASEVGPRLDADGNYEREQTPQAAVLTEDGRLVLLSSETASAAHLLVFLSPGCGPCGRIGPHLGDWAEQLAPVVVRAVVMAPAAERRARCRTSPATPGTTRTASPARPSASAPRPRCCSAPTGCSPAARCRARTTSARSWPRSPST